MKIADKVQGLDAIKLAAYQHIQDHKQKLMNRLSYVLLQHIVKLYQTNEYLQLALAGSHSTAQRCIADAIELYMQEIIEGNVKNNCASAEYLKSQERGERVKGNRIKQLEEEVVCLRESIKDLKKELGREVKRTQKAVQKYNILSELTLDISHRHKSDLTLLQEKHQLKINQLEAKNSELKEKVIKLDTLIELYSNNTTDSKSVPIKLQTLQDKKNKFVYKSFVFYSQSAEVKPYIISQPKLSIESINSLTFGLNIAKPILQAQAEPKIKLNPVVKCERQTQHQMSIQQKRLFKDQSTQTLSCQSSFDMQTQYQKGKEQEETGYSDLLLQVKPKYDQLEAQIKILTCLNHNYQKQTRQARGEASTFKSEKVQLVHLCNRLQDQTNRLNRYISELELQIQEQNQLIVAFDQEKHKLVRLINQLQSNNFNFQTQIKNQLQTLKQESQSEGRLTETEESSSTTPKNNEMQSCQPETLTTAPDQSSTSVHPQSSIPKEVISRYLLEMLDQRCRGEAKLILVDQIGECLGWSSEDYKRVQFYKRRERLRDKASSLKEPGSQNLEDMFYRFLKGQCGQE